MTRTRCVTEYANHLMKDVGQRNITPEKKRAIQKLIDRIVRCYEFGYTTINETMYKLAEIGMFPEAALETYAYLLSR